MGEEYEQEEYEQILIEQEEYEDYSDEDSEDEYDEEYEPEQVEERTSEQEGYIVNRGATENYDTEYSEYELLLEQVEERTSEQEDIEDDADLEDYELENQRLLEIAINIGYIPDDSEDSDSEEDLDEEEEYDGVIPDNYDLELQEEVRIRHPVPAA